VRKPAAGPKRGLKSIALWDQRSKRKSAWREGLKNGKRRSEEAGEESRSTDHVVAYKSFMRNEKGLEEGQRKEKSRKKKEVSDGE